jgi:glutathione S-transferase
MIRVHHLNNSRSQRVLWLLEELSAPYEIVPYQRDRQTMLAPPELRAIHPLGKSPVIEADGLVIAETGAIVEHLARRHGGAAWAAPTDAAARVRHSYWMHFAEGSAMTPLLLKLYLSRLGEAAAPLSARVDKQIEAMLAYLEGELTAPFFMGEEIAAPDVMMSFPLEAAAARGGLDSAFPRLSGWLERIHARPAYQRALERGGPYELLR